MTRVARRAVVTLGLLLAGLWACGEEPDKLVSTMTDDGAFELTLEARKNHLKPGESLPVLVSLESLRGQLSETVRDTITLLSNAGSVTPNRLVFTFVGSDDTLYSGGGVISSYEDWISFALSTSSSQANSERQGEVIALFRDLQAVLKIRIVAD